MPSADTPIDRPTTLTTPPGAGSHRAVALEIKFQAPRPVASQVVRKGLCDAICNGVGQLVLVRAPAGFGKTTAMVQARERLEREGVATVWLTLDRADNDASRFLSGLEQAVSRLGLLDPQDTGGRDAVQVLAQAETPFALFLDEFETVQEAAVLGLVREIAEHLPRRGRLIIGSRSLPPLGLARLRVRGQLTEIDTERLRFTLEDAATFFDQRRANVLNADQLFRLHQKTEGWIAALWLASMALNRSGDASDFVERFSGSDRAVADYLAEEVLARQPAPIRQFLLRTSLLRQLDASVCAALNPRTDCATLLEQLDADHLLLTPVAGEQRTWRYHSLFADYLRAQLEREHPDDVARLHLAASGWYESQERPVPAIDHAIEGGDFPHAMALLDANAEDFLTQGRMRLLARWFTTLPPAQLSEHPGLQMVAVWAACFTRGPWEAMDLLDRSGADASDDPHLRAHAAGLRPMLLAMQDRNEEALVIGRESLRRLPTGNHFADSALLNAMAHIAGVTGQPREAQQLLDAARREQGDSTFNRMYSESNEGLLDLQQGRLRQATARFRLAVDATHAVNYHHTHGNAWAGVFYTSVVYEANQIAQADHLLNVYLPLARDVGLPDHMIVSHAMRSRIAFINGDVDAASLALTELEYLGNQRKLPRVVAGAKLERARLLLLQGHGAAAHDELVRADDPTLWDHEQRLRLLAHDIEYMALGSGVRRRQLRAATDRCANPQRHHRHAPPPVAGAAPAARAGAAAHRRHTGRSGASGQRAAVRLPGRLHAAGARRRAGRGPAGATLPGPARQRPGARPTDGRLPAAPAAGLRPPALGRGARCRAPPRRAGAAHAQGNPRAGIVGGRLFEQRDGREALRIGQHRANPSAPHQHEAGRAQPYAGGGDRTPPRTRYLKALRPMG